MRVLFAGTPDFAVPPLKALSAEHEIVGVFTQPDRRSGRGKKVTAPPVKLLAEQLGFEIHQPESLKDQANVIQALAPDVMVVVAYGMLLPQAILDIPKYGCINIHASILPRWRGAAPIHRAIEAGDSETGVAIMQMELGLDTGPVFETLTTPILTKDTTATLHDKLAELGAIGVCKTLTRIESEPGFRPTPQPEDGACYAKKISKDEAAIDWLLSANALHQKIRAFIPFPICQFQHDQTRIRIWQASVVSNTSESTDTGRIIDVQPEGPVVQCGRGSLRLEVLQRDGARAMPWSDFKNGYTLAPGDQLR